MILFFQVYLFHLLTINLSVYLGDPQHPIHPTVMSHYCDVTHRMIIFILTAMF